MAALGYVQGKNLELDERWGDNSREALERMALEAAALKPAVFVTQGPALHVVRKLPGTTPVVFGNSGDPVDTGVAKSMARPGGHFTGGGRPGNGGFALCGNQRARARARPGGDRCRARRSARRAPGWPDDPAAAAIARFSIQHRTPTISGWAAIAEAGSLLTYGPLLQECYRRLAYFVDRILRGAKPADLPIEFPTKVELVVNLKTAKALGITIPPAVLLRADQVIV